MRMTIIERIFRCVARNNNSCSLSKITASLPDVNIDKREKAINQLIEMGVIKPERVTRRRFSGAGRSYEKTIYKIVG